MSNELVINAAEPSTRIALLKNRELVEYHQESKGHNFTVGDLYLGMVKKVVPGLNGAFIDVGYERDAFLHYHDLGPQFRSLVKYTKSALGKRNLSPSLTEFKIEPEINKFGKINQVLSKNQKILVQITKEPISNKGPRLATEISIPGRYIVLVPFTNVISVSRKITSSAERKRLKRLISSIKPENFGVIIRTVAEGAEVAELNKDLRNLISNWTKAYKNLHNASPKDKVWGEPNRANTLIRDLMNESFDSIVIDDKETFLEIKEYINQIAPDKTKIVKHYVGKNKLFEVKGIEKQIKQVFGESVALKGGGYLIIEHTEALHVIDVNSGIKSTTEESQETTAVSTNLLAAKEITRQLRLRDMGGIIVVDFIDMKSAENRKKVYDEMKKIMKEDKAKSVILPLSKFGLLQITRQRVRPEMNIATKEVCPTCHGTGKIDASILVSDIINNKLEYIIRNLNQKRISLAVHPFLHAYFTKGIFSQRYKWWRRFGTWINMVKDSSLGLTEFGFYDKQGEEIELK